MSLSARERIQFGEAGLALLPEIEALDDTEKYQAINCAIAVANDLEDVRKVWAPAS